MAKCGKRGGKGGRIVAAGLAVAVVLACALGLVEAAGPGATSLTFRDNASNEQSFEVERHEGACGVGTFVKAATLPASTAPGATVSWIDATTVVGKAYCYRVRACNNSMLDGSGVTQCSGYTNEAGATYPLAIPAAPSTATAD